MDKSMNQGEAFEHYRVLLFSIAYRMTGSASDAEDLVQETYLRYQASADQEIVSLKAYLSTIITRLSLDYLKSARVVREQYVGVWLPEPILTSHDDNILEAEAEASLELQEALSLAFLRLLESLSPPERAVFLLHEVFHYPFPEIGTMLEKSTANCRQIFHRAKQALQDGRTRFEPEPQRQRQLVLGFLSASQAGNMEALTSLLAQDTVSWSDSGGKTQSNLKPIYGQQAVARFWLNVTRKTPRPLTATLADINGSPAILYWDEDQLAVVISMTVSNAGIQEIYALLNSEKLAYLQKQLSHML
ncbi:DNA-directed RNA polymerase sigma-70 factor [Reticulibacter mediterranei]|uniref:DNA-directed RNA polymerase sigma-70 factor n=1 Tax=Reticulibacter mediterranei TaxID=2778369 RepID=A0A8J3N3K6_9CHLR|nr:RNA polymerase sigma-70 factor [Reticulibacter mediterranei]GHO97162.1 DNA-directed RNA polymerase sigma-70 factor [Reticulibacter mediterranei]